MTLFLILFVVFFWVTFGIFNVMLYGHIGP